jgi:hypothetical protein
VTDSQLILFECVVGDPINEMSRICIATPFLRLEAGAVGPSLWIRTELDRNAGKKPIGFDPIDAQRTDPLSVVGATRLQISRHSMSFGLFGL